MATTKKYVSLEKLSLYDEKIKALIDSKDAAVLAQAKAYCDDKDDQFEAAGSVATAKAEAIASAQSYADTKVNALTDGQVKTNTDAIAAIKDDENIDSFADVVAELAKKQNTGDYATKTEAQGYANAKDASIAEAKNAADAAQSTADTNADAIAAINNETAGILAKAKSFATTEDAKVQANVDTLSGKVGTVPEGQTVMGIITNIQENAYDDSEITGRIDELEGEVDTLIGSDANKSVRTISAEEVAKIVAGADESFDTLKEIADWISTHGTDATAMNSAIMALQAIVDGIGGDGESATVVAYVQSAIAALNIGDYAKAADLTALAGRVSTLETDSATHAKQTDLDAEVTARTDANSALDARLKAVESAVGSSGSVATDIAAAKQEAIDAAAADATSKANAAETAAKAYADGLDDAMDERVQVLEAATHTHANKALLDTYTQTEANLSDAVAKKHEHSNLEVLEGITATKVSAWDAAEQNAKDYAKTYANGLNDSMDSRMDAVEAWQTNMIEVSEEEIAQLFA